MQMITYRSESDLPDIVEIQNIVKYIVAYIRKGYQTNH